MDEETANSPSIISTDMNETSITTSPQVDMPLGKPPKPPHSNRRNSIRSQTSETSSQRERSTSFLLRLSQAEEDLISETAEVITHSNPKLFFRVTAIGSFFSITVFVIWFLTSPYSFPWFIYPIWLTSLIISIIFISGAQRYTNKPYSIHTAFFVLTAFMLILTNIYASRHETSFGFPWSIYPIGIMMIAFGIHSLHAVFPKYFHHFSIHVVVSVVTQVLIFLSWGFAGRGFPWFLFVWLGGVILLAIHYPLKKKKVFEKLFSWIRERRLNKYKQEILQPNDSVPSNKTDEEHISQQPNDTITGTYQQV